MNNRRITFSIIAFFLGLAVVLTLSEILLRITGVQPWKFSIKDSNEPTLHEFDSVLGWKNKAGNYLVPAYAPGQADIKMTFLDGGRRATQKREETPGDNIVVTVGGSFTQGWAVSDSETFAWKIQSNYPGIRVLNYGTAGYGTYQSLLVLERIFSGSETPPVMVLYGFIELHEARNVAPSGWLRLLSMFSRRKHVFLPYCTINSNDKLERHAPEQYPVWPLREYLASVTFFQSWLMSWRTQERYNQRRAVTERLLTEMSILCQKNGSKFLVILLRDKTGSKTQYTTFFNKEQINYLDCLYPITADKQVVGEGHPNGKMHTLWANCIGSRLDDLMADPLYIKK